MRYDLLKGGLQGRITPIIHGGNLNQLIRFTKYGHPHTECDQNYVIRQRKALGRLVGLDERRKRDYELICEQILRKSRESLELESL